MSGYKPLRGGIPSSQKGAANGVAALDADGLLDEALAFRGWNTGRYMTPTLIISGNRSMSNGVVCAVPWWLPFDLPISAIAVNVAIEGTSGAVVRLGAYKPASATQAALLFDAGTVDATTTGVKSISVEQTLPKGLVWLVAAGQGSPGTAPQLTAANGYLTPYGSTAEFRTTINVGSFTTATGALPALATGAGGSVAGVPHISVVVA